jgi:hypothetical protein
MDSSFFRIGDWLVEPLQNRLVEEEPVAPTRIHVVLDWAQELKKKVPSAAQ